MDKAINHLRAALGDSAVRTDAYALDAYGVDRTTQWQPKPSCVVMPESIGQVQAVIRLANEHRFAVVPSGGRTGLSGGAVAARGEVVLSMDRMNAIKTFDAVDQTVTVEAGLVTQRLQEYAADQGLFYPVDFASSGSSQIGGNIATNAGGIKVIRYGMTRDWVRGLTVVTGAGEVLELNGGLLKNNTGYDFRHLCVGSEGTLAVICEATMGLTRSPGDPQVLVMGVSDFGALMPVLRAFQQRMALNAFECFSDNGLRRVLEAHGLPAPFETPAPYYALLEFEDDGRTLDVAMAAFEDCVEDGWVLDGVVSQSLGQAQDLWAMREYMSETLARWKPYKSDLSVAVSRLPAFIRDADAMMRERHPQFEVVWFGHIGDGNLHLNVLKPDELSVEAFTERCGPVGEDVSRLVHAHGGSISAEHGIGLLKRPYLHYSRSEADIALMRQVKQVFDPNGVLNPGKIFTAAQH